MNSLKILVEAHQGMLIDGRKLAFCIKDCSKPRKAWIIININCSAYRVCCEYITTMWVHRN